MFQTKVVKKIKARNLFSVTFFSKIVPFMKYLEKYGKPGRQATDDNMAHTHCMLDT
jgi:hypothetical protein